MLTVAGSSATCRPPGIARADRPAPASRASRVRTRRSSCPAALRVNVRPEHLTRPGVAVGDQPHHPGGHRLGLARAGPGDHHERSGRCGDDRGLLVGGREQAEGGGQFGRAVARRHGCPHPSPTVWAGQLARTGQCAQPSLMRATNCGPCVAAAARCTISRHSSRASRVSASCSRSVAPPAAGLAEVHQAGAAGLLALRQ